MKLPAWLDEKFKKWGASTTLQSASDCCHFLFPFSTIIAAFLLFSVLRSAMAGFIAAHIVGVGWAIFGYWKEFWFDLRYEPLIVSGGKEGGIQDFTGYCLGIISAMGLIVIVLVIRRG